METDLKALLDTTFRRAGVYPADTQQFISYIETLKKWNKHINLYSRKLNCDSELINILIAPSLLFFKITEQLSLKRIIDVGSGAGIPGLIIKLTNPALDVVLVEPNAKKSAFLSYVCAKLGITCSICRTPLEQVEEGGFDVATVRGLKLTGDMISALKEKSRWLVAFEAPTNHLPLPSVASASTNRIRATLYRL